MKILEIFSTLKISASFKCLQLDIQITQYKKLPTFYIFQKNNWIITNKHLQEVEEDIIFLRSKTFIRWFI